MKKCSAGEQVPRTKFSYWLSLVSLVWVVGAIWLLIQTSPCLGEQFTEKFLSCRTPNELGDFLAGVFAPLAFLWLAGAVVIQSHELSAQRSELELTRRIQEAQFNEMKAQAKYIGEQTNLLRLETEDRRKTFTSREITHCLGTIQRLASSTGCDIMVRIGRKNIQISFALAKYAPLQSLLVTIGGLTELEKHLDCDDFELISGRLPLKGIGELLAEAINLSSTQGSRENVVFEQFNLRGELSKLKRMIDTHPEICL